MKRQRGIIFQLVVPKDMRLLIFDNLHSAETAGHFGRDRTVESTKRRYYWPGLKENIAR